MKKLRRRAGLLLSELKAIRSPVTWYRWIWYVYSEGVKAICLLRDRRRRADAEFSALGFKQGAFAQNDITPFISALERAQVKGLSEDDYLPGYLPSDVHRYIKTINESHRHLRLGEEQLRALAPLVAIIAPKIEECLGAPWRIVNIRCWKTRASAEMVGSNGPLHVDGFPPHILKTMIYFTPPSMETGSTELVLEDGTTHAAEGPAGTWLLFRNSKLMHRGVTPKKGERILLELTIVPALNHDPRLVCAGENALYPKFPWV